MGESDAAQKARKEFEMAEREQGRTERALNEAQKIVDGLDVEIGRLHGLASKARLRWKQATKAGDQMNSQQLEDQAAEARDEIADQTDALAQREAESDSIVDDATSAKIEKLEAERDELQARATAAMRELGLEPMLLPMTEVEKRCAVMEHVNAKLLEKRDEASGRIEELETCLRLAEARSKAMFTARDHWEDVAHECSSKLDVEVGRNLALQKQFDGPAGLVSRVKELETELRLSKEETVSTAKISSQWQSEACDLGSRLDTLKGRFNVLTARAEDAEAKKATWMRLHDEAKQEVSALRKRIAAAEPASKVETEIANTKVSLRSLRLARRVLGQARVERDALRSALVDVEARAQYLMLSCENILKLIHALEQKGETDGTDTGM